MLMNLSENIQSGIQAQEYHKAVVVDNRDPLQAHRVRALVEGRIEVPSSQYDRLPWIQPERTIGSGGREDSMSMQVPPIGSEVKVRFIKDSPYLAVYSGSYESTEYQNRQLFNNYPDMRGQINPDGSWQRTDPGRGTEFFHGLTGAYIKLNTDGSILVNAPRGVMVNVEGPLDIACESFNVKTGAYNVKASSLTEDISGSINTKAGGSILTDGSTIRDQTGASNVSAAGSAASRIERAASELERNVQELTRQTDAMVEGGQTFNQQVVQQGIEASAEPTVGARENIIRTVLGGLNLGGGFNPAGGGLLGRVVGGMGNLRNAATSLSTAVQTNTRLGGIIQQAQQYRSMLDSFNPSRIGSARDAVNAVDQLLNQVGSTTGVNIATSIRSRRTEIEAALALAEGRVGDLQQISAIRQQLPRLLEETRQLEATPTYGNDALQADAINQLTTVEPVNIEAELSVMQERLTEIQRVAGIALSYESADATVTELQQQTQPDMVDVHHMRNRMRSINGAL